MTQSSRMPEYADEQVLLSVEPPTASRSTIRLRAAGLSVRALLDRFAAGACGLADMLKVAAVTAAAEVPGGDLQ